MNVKINPKLLSGEVDIPASKSVAHRLIICASLSQGESIIENIYPSKDILATINAMKILGADIVVDGTTARVNGITNPPESATVDCNESGSTLRFLIPVAAALGVNAVFIGGGKLPQRPITPYLEEFPKHNVCFDYNNTMPFSIKGKLTSGKYFVSGNVSSQFITGLIFGLILCDGDSEIILTSHLESKPYVDITVDCLSKFGGKISATDNGYIINGGQKLTACSCAVEGDYSQAAFFYVANSLGSNIQINGLDVKSVQGDKKIVEICNKIVYNKNGKHNSFVLDCSDTPDLVPALAVLASFCDGKTILTNVERLRIKECDRLDAVSTCLNRIGGKVKCNKDSLEIDGVKSFSGGTVEAYNDHRIAMAMAVAATRCTDTLVINGAECVAKSYPDFFEVYKRLGGDFEVINQ